MSDPIILESYPEGTEYEELIAACFQLKGFYIERNIIEREVKDVLELDVITTGYDNELPEISIIEVKSGRWGFNEIFKLRGWLDYVKISEGLLVVKDKRENFEFYYEKSSTLDIEVLNFSEIDELENHFDISGEDSLDIEHWRFSYMMERELIKTLKGLKKDHLSLKCYKAIDQYYQKIKGGVFFTRNTSERLKSLYDNFKKYPSITSRTANELDSGEFVEKKMPKKIFDKTFYKCAFTPLHITTFVEYLSRLTILKNAVDFHLYGTADIKKVGDKISFQTEGKSLSVLDFLPESFINGIERLSSQPYFNRYPIFWQWFIFFFGGFLLLDHLDKEYELLSEKTGIPIEYIEDALSAFDYLFPVSSGWFIYPNNYNIKLLKTFPMPWRGIGANYRLHKYLDNDSSYDDLGLTGLYTVQNLSKWHNLGYKVLSERHL